MDLSNLLLSRFHAGNLAHFYILKSENGLEFSLLLLSKMVASALKITPESAKKRIENGHPDTLFIPALNAKQSEDHNFKSDEFKDFFDFLDYRSIELPWRFIVVNNAHKISTIIANKLLKSLEAPTPKTTIFFINPTGKNLLKTIESRAITLTLQRKEIPDLKGPVTFSTLLNSAPISDQHKELLKKWYSEGAGSIELTEILKKHHHLEVVLYRVFTEGLNRLDVSYHAYDSFLTESQTIQKLKATNLLSSSRLLPLLDSIRSLPA